MVAAMNSEMEILFELKLVDQGTTIWTFDPQALRHVVTTFMAAQARFAENAHKVEKMISITLC